MLVFKFQPSKLISQFYFKNIHLLNQNKSMITIIIVICFCFDFCFFLGGKGYNSAQLNRGDGPYWSFNQQTPKYFKASLLLWEIPVYCKSTKYNYTSWFRFSLKREKRTETSFIRLQSFYWLPKPETAEINLFIRMNATSSCKHSCSIYRTWRWFFSCIFHHHNQIHGMFLCMYRPSKEMTCQHSLSSLQSFTC